MAQPDPLITPFAENATPGTIDPIPETAGPSDPPQKATWNLGFPGVTMTPLAAGGLPPRGQDFNGVLKAISEHTVFVGGGGQYKWDADFAAADGYPLGAVLQKSGNNGAWLNTVDGNDTDPDSGGAGWVDANSTVLPYALDTGAANAYVATYTPALAALSTGQVVRFKASNANTGASTFNPNGLGAKPIVSLAGAALSSGAIAANGHVWLQYDASIGGGSWVSLLGPMSTTPPLPSGYFSGFTLFNNSGAPNTTVDVGQGTARSPDNTVDITLTGTLRGILQSSGAWAAGDNQNKLDAGAKAINSWYHVFAIRKTSDGTGDILFSLSPTAPTMPSGYAGFRRISAVRTDASGNIIQFLNFGRNFTFKTPILDVDIAAAIVDAAYVLSVPTGVEAKAKIGMFCSGNDASWSYRSPSANAIVPSHTDYRGGSLLVTTEVPDRLAVDTEIVTNASAQIHFRTALSSAFRVVTYGWTEL